MRKPLNFLLLFFFFSIQLTAQTDDAKALLVNEWALESFEVNDQIHPPQGAAIGSKMIFNSDGTAISRSANREDHGKWTYDESAKMIHVVDADSKLDMHIKLIRISKTECVVEIENPKGTFIKLNMVGASK